MKNRLIILVMILALAIEFTFVYAENALTLSSSYSPLNSIVTVYGKFGTAPGEGVTVKILPVNVALTVDEVNSGSVLLKTVFTGQNGVYSAQLGLSEDSRGGEYVVSVSAQGQTQTNNFYHISKTEAQPILTLINSTESADILGSLMTADNLTRLGIDSAEYLDGAGYVNDYLFAKSPQGGYGEADFYSACYTAISAAYLVNGKKDAKDVLKKYESILGINYSLDVEPLLSDVWTYTNSFLKRQDFKTIDISQALWAGSLIGKIRCASRYTLMENLIMNNLTRLGISLQEYNNVSNKQNVWTEFYSRRLQISEVEHISTHFYQSVSYALNLEKTDPPGNGGNGGGGGGGGGGGNVGNTQSAFEVVGELPLPDIDVAPKISSFSDISEHWSRETVEKLVEKGVISGFEDGTFRPDNSVTRGEFVKILSTAIGFKVSSPAQEYTDVSEDDWFAPFVYAASDNGIVFGSDGFFFPHSNITRQDAAAMLYRTVEQQGRMLFGDTIFSDSMDIAPYASDAVSKLASAGLLRGSEGMFYPMSNTTRAEAATMIFNLINYLTNE